MLELFDDDGSIVMSLGKERIKSRMAKLGMSEVQVYQLRTVARGQTPKNPVEMPKESPAVTAGSNPESRVRSMPEVDALSKLPAGGKLKTSLVEVKGITTSIPESRFDSEKIELAARAILETNGSISPMVVRRKKGSFDSYSVVGEDSAFQYYAAKRAREINPLRGDMALAVIVDNKNVKPVLNQLRERGKNNSGNSTKIKGQPSIDQLKSKAGIAPKLIPKLAFVQEISSSSKQKHDPAKIERAARDIVAANGTINPIVVRRSGTTANPSYRVVSNDFEYQAAKRAREINPARSELIQVVIADTGNIRAVANQIKASRK